MKVTQLTEYASSVLQVTVVTNGIFSIGIQRGSNLIYSFCPDFSIEFYLEEDNFLFSINLFRMGNLMTETIKLYSLEWIPRKPIEEIIQVQNEDELPNPINSKILIPMSKISSKRDFILKCHHHVVIIKDTPGDDDLLRLSLRGIPIINEYDLSKSPASCANLQYNQQFCPIPIVLERFHESYVKNYVNSFHFYGINILAYSKIEQYLKSSCSNRFLICSNYELEQLSFKFQRRSSSKESNKILTVLCFCNKDEYSLSKRIELFLQKQGIQVFFFQNLLDIIERINAEFLVMPSELQLRTEKLLFYLSDKQKEVDYLSKMAKRLQKSIRNIVVEKVHCKQGLISKAQHMPYSIIIVSNDSKEMRNYFELYENLQREGLEDRIIFIRRQNEINQKFTQRVYNVVEKSKYRKCSIFEKQLIFYGCSQFFKMVLKSYPNLKFKKFIDCNREKEKIKQFLGIQTEVIVTNLKLCSCQENYSHENIKCTIIYLRNKYSTVKTYERRDSEGCQKQQWFLDEEELLHFYTRPNTSLLSVNFNYQNKKISYIGKTLNEFFAKMKQKKTILYNKLNDTMFLFSSEYYTLDQMSSFIIKSFCTKMLGNYEQSCLFAQLKFLLHEELTFLCRNKRIEQQILEHLENDMSTDIYELSEQIMSLMSQFPQLLEELNSIWALFLYQDRKQHHTNCQTLLFLLILAFNKTNFVKYKNETLQSLKLVVKRSSAIYDSENLTTFRNKNRNNFVYNVQFLACQVYKEGQSDANDIVIKVEGNQLTSFHMYLPLWKKDNRVIICPFTKFQITTNADKGYLLKLSVNSQHKLLQKFVQTFLEQNGNQLKLFDEDREVRKFDVFLDSMAHSKFETAGYILKKIMKEEKMVNEDCMNAFSVLYHLKRNELQLAKEKLRGDKYNEILSKVIKTLKAGEQFSSDQKYLIPETFSSSKRIQESNKEYQNIEQTSNDNESIQNSALIQTDPEMIKQLSSEYKLLNLKFNRNRSPSTMKQEKIINKGSTKIPIYNKRVKPDLSICDKLSETSKTSFQQKEKQMSIVILPPLTKLSSYDKQSQICYNSSTFGSKFLTQYSSMSSEKQRKSKQDCSQLLRMKSSKSDAGDMLSYKDNILESSPLLKKTSSIIKQSQFVKELQNPYQSSDAESSKEELLQPNENELTGNFNFSIIKFDKELPPSEQIIEEEKQEMDEVLQESEKQSDAQLNRSSKSSIKGFSQLDESNEKAKLFPIKKQQFFKFPRKSLTQMHNNLQLFQSPLRNIEEERSSQFSLSNSNSALQMSPNQKENCEKVRSKDGKLFTFFKNNEIKPRFSISSNKNSLILSNVSELQKIDEKKESLLYNFQDEQKRQQNISSMNSVSSIEIEEAEQIYPQELVKTFASMQ